MPTNKFFGLLFGRPDSNSPIVRAGQEDRIIDLVPERVAPHLIDRTGMPMEHLHVLLAVADLALQNGAVFRRAEVVDTLVVVGEVDREAARVDK